MFAPRRSQRFPLRTLVLMVLAVVAFIWMWVMTHRYRDITPNEPPVQLVPVVPPTHPTPDE